MTARQYRVKSPQKNAFSTRYSRRKIRFTFLPFFPNKYITDSPTDMEKEKSTVEFVPVVSGDDINELADIAWEVWHEFFSSLLSPGQIDYMVEKFQSRRAVSEQLAGGYGYFFMVLENGEKIGYTGVKTDGGKLFLSKLYRLKKYRGCGYASQAFAFLEDMCRDKNLSSVWLTVNRHNTHSIDVYTAKGFVKVREQVADIGCGYVMDDYIMEKYVI